MCLNKTMHTPHPNKSNPYRAIEAYIYTHMATSKQSCHIILVHGAGHGAWCWYKVRPLLEAAGHRVTALDLAASGIDCKNFDELHAFEDYSRPLLEVMAAIPEAEKVVLVGHSLGGMNISLAMEMYPHKISVAVFVAAFMPDFTHSPSYVIEKFKETKPAGEWLDTKFSVCGENSFLFGPNFISSKLYQLCSPQDVALAKMLVRRSSLFVEDLSKRSAFTEKGYGSVKKVYVVCPHDQTIPLDFQRWEIERIGVEQVKVIEIENADHMPMMSTPNHLCQFLLDIANNYV